MEALRERFGKYHVLEKIAQGGMAEVYKVKTVGIAGFEKVQALKRILPASAREGRFIRSFIDEARIAVELAHRNIVQVFDFGKADGELFLAMELIEGKDLRTALGQAVSRDLLPSVEIGAYIVSEVAAGLDYAHRKTDGYGGSLGIVHCDVSPSNVMLSTDGYVKILDFGIARASFASALERRRLRGKPRYMAPEQTLGEPATPAADVFALGIIAWELFTGRPLYRGADVKAILDAVRRTVPPPIDRLNPHVPPEIVAAVATALAREPHARGTAADLAAACARTALGAGARVLAAWLGELERRPSRVELPWQHDATSISVPARSRSLADDAPSRPSTTAVLADVPAPLAAFGEGTPGFAGDAGTRPSTTRLDLMPAHRDSTAPTHRIAREVTATTSTATTRASGFAARIEPTVTIAPARWSEPALPPLAEPAARPSPPHLGDDPTHHGLVLPIALRGAPDDTSYDELDVEPAPPVDARPASAPPLEEPIDDELAILAATVAAERRRAVIVAGVLAGAARDALRPVARSLGELAYQRGGVVLELADDALVVGFGLEVAGEDDVAVAMGWALDAAALARDAVARPGAARDDDVRIELRTGARAGVAITRDARGATHVPAEALDEARTLARDATADRPLFVGGAGRLTSGLYALREVPSPRRVARRSKVLEVLGPRGFDERDRARFERRGRFVGRAAELTALERWLERAIADDRRLAVVIAGAAGTGKSRLVAELIARRSEAGAPLRVVTTGASLANQHAPFAVVIDLYQAALGLPPARGRVARGQLVQRLLHLLARAGVPDERARAIASDLDHAMELRDGVAVAAPDSADLRPRISAGFAAFRAAMATGRDPLVTVIEDVHLADSASLEVLRHALAAPAAAPELLILTARPDGAAPPLVDGTIMLGDLVGGELRALIADRLGDAATPFNIAAVLARGGGNPLFVEELARAVRDAGDDDVPASAREVIAARIERLSANARAALRFAAVLGASIRARLLEELIGAESLETELAELVDAGLLARAGDGELQFARGLVREVVYEELSARTQRETHARIGRLLASRFFAGREEPPAAIAEHLQRGGELAGAAAFWLRAGQLALAASDAAAAVACFTRTLGLERELGPTPPTAPSRARRRAALAGRDDAHRLRGDLACDAGDLDELQRLADGDPRRLADVAIRRAQRLLRLGDHAAASIATVVAEDHALAADDARLRGEALRVRSEILEHLGRFDEALAVVAAARELFHRERATRDEMAAQIGRGRILLLRAQYAAAHDAYRPVLARIAQTGDPWLERVATNHVALIETCLGNFERAMGFAQRSLELCRRDGDRAREGDALAVIGIIALEVGLDAQAAAMFADALAILDQSASPWSRADCLIYAGRCDVRRGDPNGLARLDAAVAEARRLSARYLEANALVARAGARLRLGDPRGAVDDAAAGVAIARAASLIGYEIQGLARHGLALVRRGGDAGEAVALAQRALALLEQQQHLEGSEEEVFAACAEILRAAGAADEAAALHARGRASARRKLEGLADVTWRAAYAAIPEIQALLAA